MSGSDSQVETQAPAEPAAKEEERSKAPIIILGTMVVMSVITISFVFIAHLRRDQPYLDSKMRVVRYERAPFVPILSLNYSEFGPQALAADLIGPEWWQWQASGSSDPKQRYDIKVVVYYGLSEADIAINYPVNDLKFMDYRYLELERALDFLDAKIEENTLPELTLQLEATREKLIEYFYETGP